MKLGFASFVIAAAVLAAPASAQDAGAEAVMNMDAPAISETQVAAPDWYRRFAVIEPKLGDEVWQTEPTDDTSFNWTQGRRWQLNVDLLSRPDTSPLPREEMRGGATFRITPRLSVGGEVSVGANELDDTSQWEEQQIEAGIRLKSAFKF